MFGFTVSPASIICLVNTGISASAQNIVNILGSGDEELRSPVRV